LWIELESTCQYGRQKDFFRGGGGKSGFFQVVPNNGECHFDNSKLGEKHFSTISLIRKCQISKSKATPLCQRPMPVKINILLEMLTNTYLLLSFFSQSNACRNRI